MAEVECEVEYTDVEDDGKCLPGIRVTCGECDLQVECFGQTSRSVRRCLAMLRDDCELEQSNFYIAPDSDD